MACCGLRCCMSVCMMRQNCYQTEQCGTGGGLNKCADDDACESKGKGCCKEGKGECKEEGDDCCKKGKEKCEGEKKIVVDSVVVKK